MDDFPGSALGRIVLSDFQDRRYRTVYLGESSSIFGRERFLNEIIWAYDYGGRPTRKWPSKHDNILVYVKNSDSYYFDTSEVERIP